jgi:hypothetical protein
MTTTDNQPTAVPRVITADPGVQPEHGYTPGYLPRNVLGSDHDLKAAIEALGGAA